MVDNCACCEGEKGTKATNRGERYAFSDNLNENVLPLVKENSSMECGQPDSALAVMKIWVSGEKSHDK